MNHQTDLRIKERSMLRHRVQVLLRGVRAVLYLGAPGIRRGAHSRTIRMDQRPQALCFSFSAGCLNLFIGKRLPAALADAARGKDLYQVGAIRLEFFYSFADL